MKKAHKIAFVIVLIIACFSAYSLAEINQSSKIDFSWFDGNVFRYADRNYLGQNNFSKYPQYMDFDILMDNNKIVTINGESTIKNVNIPNIDFEKEFLIYCTLGEVPTSGNSIKVKEISERGNVVEVLLYISSVDPSESMLLENNYPYDIVKINKKDLTIDGDTLFIFKDDKGNELFRKNCHIVNKNE